MNIIELAKECGFKPHIIHGGLIVKHSSGAWVDISSNLESFATDIAKQAVEEYKAGLVPVAWICDGKPYLKKQRKLFSKVMGDEYEGQIPLYALGVNVIDERLGETK